MRDEDVARLSPLGFKHINMLGRYTYGHQPPAQDGVASPFPRAPFERFQA